MLRYVTLTQCAIGACVCKWNMSHSASVNRSDSPVPLLYTACYVTRDAPFFIRTLNILFWFSDFQLDQLVIDSAMEKREMEHKHATIQQRVSSYICFSQIDQIKTVWFYGTKCLNGCRKLSEKVAKKFRLLASLDHFQLLLLRSFFYVSVSGQTVFSCLPSHTHTHT